MHSLCFIRYAVQFPFSMHSELDARGRSSLSYPIYDWNSFQIEIDRLWRYTYATYFAISIFWSLNVSLTLYVLTTSFNCVARNVFLFFIVDFCCSRNFFSSRWTRTLSQGWVRFQPRREIKYLGKLTSTCLAKNTVNNDFLIFILLTFHVRSFLICKFLFLKLKAEIKRRENETSISNNVWRWEFSLAANTSYKFVDRLSTAR